ncbi:MAG: inorganic phosphate transporter [Candidatus Limnocylindrales bacterium]
MDIVLAAAIAMALAFALTNGFQDAANAIATLVATHAAQPLPAILMASVANLLGPLLVGAAVANTVATIVTVEPESAVAVIGAGLSGAVLWNLLTWYRAIPSSSSHALVGGLVGAAIATAGVGAVAWGPVIDGGLGGVLGILIGIVLATLLGFGGSWIMERVALRLARRASASFAGPVRGAQWVTSAWLAFSHGANDASKAVGVIAAMLVASGHIEDVAETSTLVVVGCSLALTIGTALGGWRIVKTIGRRIYPIRSLDGLVSQASSAGVIFGASLGGLPISTSQVVATSVVGIGAGRRRWRHVSWEVVREIGVAWLTTMPAAAILAVLTLPLWRRLSGA